MKVLAENGDFYATVGWTGGRDKAVDSGQGK